jgi:hypothetical protein
LLDELSSLDFKLLPSNIGIENIEVNSLVSSYNELFLEKQKLILVLDQITLCKTAK